MIDEHHELAYFANARESRHLRNVDLAFSNSTQLHFAPGPTIPHFQHEHSSYLTRPLCLNAHAAVCLTFDTQPPVKERGGKNHSYGSS